MKKFDLSTARVVINAIQLPRARIDLANKTPNGIKFIPHSVSKKGEKNFKVFIEYVKYTIVLFASFFGIENKLTLSYS